jgi:hypothetical protein
MITLHKNTKEEFEAEFVVRRKKMRSIATKQLLSTLYTNALADVNTTVAELAREIGTTSDDIIKKVSNLNTIHGIRILNKSNNKSSYKLVGFFTPRKRSRSKKKPVETVRIYQATGNDKLLNQVFR